ncbi:protein FAM200B-like [Vanacampus margaritifer]
MVLQPCPGLLLLLCVFRLGSTIRLHTCQLVRFIRILYVFLPFQIMYAVHRLLYGEKKNALTCACVDIHRVNIVEASMEEPPRKKRRTQGSGRHQKEWELLQASHKTTNAEILFCHFLAEHNIAFTAADHFSDLVKVMFPDSQTAKEFACRRTKATMIVKESLARGYTQDVIQYCRTHPFTLMIDESNDRTTKKRLVVLAHFFDGENTNTRLLDLPELASGTAASIFAVIDNILQENDIPWSNIVGFASDNCNTMVGKKNSVLSRIKEKNGAVFSVGCICHLGNLCVKDGLKTLPVNIDDLLVDIFYFFKNSSKRIEDFKEFQDFTNSEQEKILKHCPTRWLSLQKVVERTLSQYEALKSYFASHADVERAGKVKSIHDRLQDPVTLLTLHFLSFILPQINQFNIVFQTEACMIGDLLPEMERLLKKLLVKFVQMEHVKSADSLLAVDDTNRYLQHEDSRLAVGLGTRALFQDTNEEDEIRQTRSEKARLAVHSFKLIGRCRIFAHFVLTNQGNE